MKTVGQILKEARNEKNYSVNYVAEKTKIKSEFINAIEERKWENLPPFPTVLGFVKSLSTTLGIDDNMAIAVLKRDYPPQKLSVNPKPDVSAKFTWSPKLTFAVSVAAVLLVVFGYLIFQYFGFISPPKLNVDSPKENQQIEGSTVLVFGTTNGDAKVTVNNQPVLVDDNGKFSVSIGITQDTKEIVIKSISRSGKESTVRRKIEVRLNY